MADETSTATSDNTYPPREATAAALRETPLAALHRELGARMVPFAGYSMPVQYPAGILAEHLHCRSGAALFDVSHMGQAELTCTAGLEHAAAALERLTPAEVMALRPGRQRYALLLNDEGGIEDDFMVANLAGSPNGDRLFLVVNASRKEADFAAIAAVLPPQVRLRRREDRALLALQGPAAAGALMTLVPDAAELIEAMPFMGVIELTVGHYGVIVSRSGYTGEDGFEISVPDGEAEDFARRLLAIDGVLPAGLGSRDSLRLEAGLPLYGSDLDATTSPVEAALTFSVGKRRRTTWDFAGAGRVRAELAEGTQRLRVGLRMEGRQPARAHTPIHAPNGGAALGEVTSGGFSPSLGAPIAMGYVSREHAADQTPLDLVVRGKPLPARVSPTPFVPHRYRR